MTLRRAISAGAMLVLMATLCCPAGIAQWECCAEKPCPTARGRARRQPRYRAIEDLHVMRGLPGETDADLEELVAGTERQAEAAGSRTRLSLGVSPFVAKRNTPLCGAPFAGVREVERRMAALRHALSPRIEIEPASACWALTEYALAQGKPRAGLAALEAWRSGGSVAARKRALRTLPHAATACDGERPRA